MKLNKPYTNKDYAQLAIFANKNHFIIEDKGNYVEAVSMPIVELTYQEKRLKEYPELAEQLDMIYHDFENWKTKITEIKNKYPKI